MESLVAIIIFCGTPLILTLLGALGGFIGGKISSKVLKELDPDISKDVHAEIVKRSTKGFFCGICRWRFPMGMGLALAAVTPVQYLSYSWVLWVAIGFALMGVIGTTMAGSALFSKE